MLLAAMKCIEDPDLDSDSTAGVSWHQWDGKPHYRKYITYSCRVGMAFQDVHTRQLNNSCNYQTNGAARPTWKYNQANRLPTCIRE